jgi:hypothetical protein
MIQNRGPHAHWGSGGARQQVLPLIDGPACSLFLLPEVSLLPIRSLVVGIAVAVVATVWRSGTAQPGREEYRACGDESTRHRGVHQLLTPLSKEAGRQMPVLDSAASFDVWPRGASRCCTAVVQRSIAQQPSDELVCSWTTLHSSSIASRCEVAVWSCVVGPSVAGSIGGPPASSR